MSLEGVLRVGLQVEAGRVAGVRIGSTRPDVARTLLSGHTTAQVLAAVPLMFSLCGRSQAAASRLACAAAAGEEPSPAILDEAAAAVGAEMVREGAWRTLLNWPRALDEAPTEAAVAAARGSLAWRTEAPDARAHDAIALAAFGMPAAAFLALDSLAEFDRWADAGSTAAARFIRRARDEDTAQPATVPLLDGGQYAAWLPDLATALDADPGWTRHPTWHGAPAETGALARLQAHPLPAALMQRSGSRVTARFVARLLELALLLTGRSPAAVGALPLPDRAGLAWVENARGLLVHQVRLEAGRVGQYRIVAPTEWNFHPDGALALALMGEHADDRDALTQRTRRLVDSLDPCVSCEIGFDDA